MSLILYLLTISAMVAESSATKLFSRQSGHSAVFNLFKAGSALVLFALMAVKGFTFHLPTLIMGIVYGGGLCTSMYTGYMALSLGPMALTSMLVSFSVLIPLLFGVTIGQETFGPVKIAALVLLLLAIVLTNLDRLNKKQQTQTNRGLWLVFVFATLVLNGVCSILQKVHQTRYPGAYSREFMLFAMLVSTLAFAIVTLRKLSLKELRSVTGKRYGVLSGTTNGVANFLTLVLAGSENASILFPIVSVGKILGVLLCGRFLFNEKLKLNHYRRSLRALRL